MTLALPAFARPSLVQDIAVAATCWSNVADGPKDALAMRRADRTTPKGGAMRKVDIDELPLAAPGEAILAGRPNLTDQIDPRRAG